MRPRDTRLNTPYEMLVRFVFASRFFCFFAACFFAASALHHGSVYDAAKAVVLFAAMIAGRVWLKRADKLAECNRALEAMFRDDTTVGGDDLDALLDRREALENRRGHPGFDPWEVQAVRREITEYMKTHPESTGRLDGRRW